MSIQDLVEVAEQAITAVFSDTSEDRSVTKEELKGLSAFLDDYLTALDADEALNG